MFKFREVKESKNNNVEKVKTQKDQGFKKIKPEAGMTKLEALCFWDEMFSHRGV